MKIAVVGNGPSLSVDQLDMIAEAGIPSIACNRISLIYSETKWRPTIYVHPENFSPDLEYVREHVAMGIECWLGGIFAAHPVGQFDIDAPNVHWLKACHHWQCNFDDKEMPDEWHLPQICSFGGSVNVAMQIAVLKGFDEIILLGCDLGYRDKKKNHFHPDYEHGNEQPAFYAAKNAFFGHVQALNYIRRKKPNIKVYNATRGGLLELWERLDLRDCTK
jgi:hypothetical protein